MYIRERADRRPARPAVLPHPIARTKPHLDGVPATPGGDRLLAARLGKAGGAPAAPARLLQRQARGADLQRRLLRLQRHCGNRCVGRVLGRTSAPAGGRSIDRACPACEAENEQRSVGGSGGLRVQRSIGDGHDLTSARFAGDPVLEACFDNERLLSIGSRGEAVRKVQQALIDAGFALPQFGADAVFGNETRNAVRDFQRAQGIGIDGLVGPQTMTAFDALFAGPTPPGPTPPGPTPPGPTPPGPTPPGPVPPGPTPPGPTPPGPTPPGPTPPGPTPPAATITSQTVVADPGPRTRTTIGVGEKVDLTHSAGSATWTTTAGTLSATTGATVQLKAPDTAQTVTVGAGTASLSLTVIAPTLVRMDRQPGTGVKHTLNQPDSGIQTRVFLGPATVNFSEARYRELDVAGVPTVPGVYSCNPFSGGHCGVGGGSPCPDKALTTTVTPGMGTLSLLGDCAYSGHCGTAPPFTAGSVTVTIPYEYRVGTGPFRNFSTVVQVHTLAGDLSTLTSNKAGASGSTTVASPSVTIVQCP